MNCRSPITFLVTLLFMSLSTVHADEAKPFLHPLFTDNMVLQRGFADPVWGWTTPGTAVTVRVAGKGAKGITGADGKWTVKLPPLPAGGPYTLTVTGPQTVTLNNVLVGDVWLCSGQSNMSYQMASSLNGPAEVAAADQPQIHLFQVPQALGFAPLNLVSSQWQACTPQTAAGFTAVGYFFGRDLQQNLHVPIGLIHASWGGTPIEAWTSAEATRTLPTLQPALANFQKIALAEKGGTTFDQLMDAWYARHAPDPAPGQSWADPALDTSGWKTMNLPAWWVNTGIPIFANESIWFRRDFTLPNAWAGKDLIIHLGNVIDRDTTYVNGTKVGGQYYRGQPRDYKVPTALLKPGRNVIAIRELGFDGNAGMIDDSAHEHMEPAGDTTAVPISLAGPWLYHIEPAAPVFDPVPMPIDGDANQVTSIYNGMIAPLEPFGVKGAIWYQGEANTGNGKLYQTQLPAMIQDWRGHWGEGDFPFFIVQLANINQIPAQPVNSGWAEVREAQLLTVERVPNTGLAVAIDIGDANNIHPNNKQEVGGRLALAAEAVAYGQKIEYSGPIYQSMKSEGSTIRLRFRHLGGGLLAKGGDKLTGFAIAGADGKFVWADAKIDGATVVVSSPTVAVPTMTRYGWADNPGCNLYNQTGLPAVPFRADMSTIAGK